MSKYPHTDEAISRAVERGRPISYAMGWPRVTHGIADDPSDLLEALVADGILEQGVWSDGTTLYYIPLPPPKPHEHEWTVFRAYSHQVRLELRCDCGVTMEVPNKLPIEVPAS